MPPSRFGFAQSLVSPDLGARFASSVEISSACTPPPLGGCCAHSQQIYIYVYDQSGAASALHTSALAPPALDAAPLLTPLQSSTPLLSLPLHHRHFSFDMVRVGPLRSTFLFLTWTPDLSSTPLLSPAPLLASAPLSLRRRSSSVPLLFCAAPLFLGSPRLLSSMLLFHAASFFHAPLVSMSLTKPSSLPRRSGLSSTPLLSSTHDLVYRLYRLSV